jgi:hypothetical protein
MKGKRIVLVLTMLFLLAAGGALAGCVRVDRLSAEGPFQTRIYDNLTGFTRIEIGSAFQLQVVPSDNYSVALYAGKDFLDKLDVGVKGDTLVIALRNWTFTFNQSPRAVITLPQLTGLDLSGAVSATAEGFTTTRPFEARLSGASSLRMGLVTGPFRAEASGASRITGSLTATATDIGLSGASSIDIDGSGGDAKIGGSGASRAGLADYAVNNAVVDLSGASTAYVAATGRIDADLSGASRLTYSGQPIMGTLDASGGSSLKHVE